MPRHTMKLPRVWTLVALLVLAVMAMVSLRGCLSTGQDGAEAEALWELADTVYQNERYFEIL